MEHSHRGRLEESDEYTDWLYEQDLLAMAAKPPPPGARLALRAACMHLWEALTRPFASLGTRRSP